MIVKLKQAISEINQGILASVYLLKGNDYYIQRFFIYQLSKIFFGSSQVEIVHLSSEDMTGKEIIDKKFCFVHLDVDLYKSTIESLRFFFPKMVLGGIILIHDYHSDGIQKAIKEFKNDNQIHLIELTGSQAMIIKNN